MQLSNLTFAAMAPIWNEAALVGIAWFPELSGSVESRRSILQGRKLLSAIALHVRRATPPLTNMEHVRDLIVALDHSPDSTRCILAASGSLDLAGIDRQCCADWESGWGDPIGFLMLNIQEWRLPDVRRRWPARWL